MQNNCCHDWEKNVETIEVFGQFESFRSRKLCIYDYIQDKRNERFNSIKGLVSFLWLNIIPIIKITIKNIQEIEVYL